jgi:hypothetical protein
MTSTVADHLDTPGGFDLYGGYDPDADYMLSSRPENPLMRESVSMWISDSAGRFGLPRFTIEAVAGEWDNRGVEANIAFPDGRVLIGAGGFLPSPPKVVDGRTVTLNAGPLTFELIKPLQQWKMTFDGEAYENTVQGQVRGERTGPRKRVRIDVDATMAIPPWSPGERSRDVATVKAFGIVGGHRHEQLFNCKGRMTVAGEDPIDFDGTGLRVRRYGARDTGEFPGHVWMSALFPSGKGFGVQVFPPRADGTPSHNEAFLFEDGRKTYARVLEAPWMTEFVPHDGPVDLLLETDAGRVRIEGRTHDSTFVQKGNPMFGDWTQNGSETFMALPFHQGGARYVWDGEVTYGMIERSYPADKMLKR